MVDAIDTRTNFGLTQAQKQALIDNLQLEITERARKLRARYSSQAQDLRSKLERRVTRIPAAFRDRKIQDLIEEHAEKARPKPAPAVVVPAKPPRAISKLEQPAEHPVKRGQKRKSDQVSTDEAKEPTVTATAQPVENPKKRTKTAATANSKATRTVSRKAVPPLSTVLSPKSHNSRTLPRSPIKSGTLSEKPQPTAAAVAAHTSPIKTAPTSKAPSRAASRATKRGAAAAATAISGGASDKENSGTTRPSDASSASATTTIVTRTAARPRATTKKQPTTTGSAARGTVAAAVKKLTATKKENVPPAPQPVASGRTLRKRN